ncbi:MAG TPA: hypothetical protein VMV74_06485 [Bacteroidales bacterium]|nr:hypothetical protein [Bacteroidales bacterium]
MIINHRLDKSFGPVGSSAGIFVFIAGIISTYFSFTGIVLVLLGAFVGFSSSSTAIDFDKRRIRFSNDIFGFVKTGKWINIEPEMKLGIRHEDRVWRAYSRSNRILDIATDDLRIFIFTSENKIIMPVMKTDSPEIAEAELEKLGAELGLSLI